MFFEMIFGDDTWKTLLFGLLATVKISGFSVLFGTILGMGICAIRMSRIRILSTIANVYIAVLRGSPVLMLLMLMYYVVFARSGIEASWVAIITFSLNVSAYMAEVFRSAIGATDKGEVEAARTLGFSKQQAFFYITLPQAIRIGSPVYESTIINLVQWTSVVGYVTITDLTRVINNISARTMKPVIMFIVGIFLYLAIAYMIKLIFYLTRGRDKK